MPITPFSIFPQTGNQWQKYLQESIVTADNFPEHTVAELAALPREVRLAFVTNETGGYVMAFRDASDAWRRCTDRAVCA